MARDALVVGINQYQFLPTLQASARDAEAIAQRLSQDGDFRVQRLPETIQAAHPQVGERTALSAQALEAALVKLFKPKGRHVPETALFYFSGHGLQKDSGLHEGYLATSEAEPQRGFFGLSLFWLRRLLQESPVRQRIVWLDCCHSGALLDFSEVDPGAVPGTSQFLMAASREYEAAYESLGGQYSVLTEAILEGLVPHRVESGTITNHSLTDWVNNQLKGELQQPLFENSGEAIWLTRLPSKLSSRSRNLSPVRPSPTSSSPAKSSPARRRSLGQPASQTTASQLSPPVAGQTNSTSARPGSAQANSLQAAASGKGYSYPEALAETPVVDSSEVDPPALDLSGSGSSGPTSATPIAPPPPFPGIKAFNTAQAYAFTGREELAQTLFRAICDNPIVSLVGGAGSGKTSLIQAGLLPLLRHYSERPISERSPKAEGGDWTVKQVTFGQYKQPLIDLAAAFVDGDATEWEQSEQLRRNSLLLAGEGRGLLQLVEQLRDRQTLMRSPEPSPNPSQSSPQNRKASQRLLLVLDPFEALLQPSSDPDMGMIRRQIMIHLGWLMQEASDWVRLILVVRSDYWDACYRATDILRQGPSRMVGVEPLDDPAMERAIAKPLQRVGWTCDPLLPSMLLSDIGQSPARMALMQMALKAMWDYQHEAEGPLSKTFDLQTYAELGGIRGLLVHQATELLETLTPAEQVLVQQIFLALTRLGKRTPDSLRSVSRADLGISSTPSARSDELVAVLETLIESRLVYSSSHRLDSLSEDELDERTSFWPLQTPNDWLQASHEALIRDWPAMQRWLKRERSRLQHQRRIEAAAQDWCDRNEMFAKEGEEGWLQGNRLREAEAYLRKHPDDLSSIAQHYIRLSQKARKKTRRETRLLQLGLPTALTATLFALVHQYFAAAPQIELRQLQALQIRETTRQILSDPEADPMTALLINRLALEQNGEQNGQQNDGPRQSQVPTRPADEVAALGQETVAEKVALEGLGESLRSLQIRGEFQGRSGLTQLQWSQDQQTLVGLDSMGQAYAWQVAPILAEADGADAAPVQIQEPRKRSRARGHAQLQQRLVWPNAPQQPPSVLMNSLLPGGWGGTRGGAADVKATHERRRPARKAAQAPVIHSLALSPDNRRVAAIAQDHKTVALWSLNSTQGTTQGAPQGAPQVKLLPEEFAAAPNQILYRPLLPQHRGTEVQSNQPSALLAVVAGHIVHLWNPGNQTGEAIQRYGTLEHLAPVEQVTFSQEGRYLLSSAGDRRLRLWDLETGIQEQELTASMPVAKIQMSPSSKLIAALGHNGTAYLWDRSSGDRLQVFKLVDKMLADQTATHLQHMQFSADESQLVIVQAGRAWVWEVASGELLNMIQLPPQAGPVRLSPDGNFLLAIENLRDLASTPAMPLVPDSQTNSQENSQAHLWNLQTGEKIRVLRESQQAIQEARFSPDGQTLVTASAKGKLSFWDSQPGHELPPLKLPNTPAFTAGDFIQPAPHAALGSSELPANPLSPSVLPWRRLRPRQGLRLPGRPSLAPEELSVPSISAPSVSGNGNSSELPTFLLVDATGSLKRWDVKLGLVEDVTQIEVGHGEIVAADWTPDLQAIATAQSDGSVQVWDVQRRELQWLEVSPSAITSTTVGQTTTAQKATDQKATNQKTTGQTIKKVEPVVMQQLQLSANGQMLLGIDSRQKLHLWNVETGQQSLWSMAIEPIEVAQLNQRGDRLLTATATGTLTLWNVATGQQIRQWSLPGFTAVALDETGEGFAVALPEGSLKLFSATSDLQTIPPLQEVMQDDLVTTLVFSKQQLIAGTQQGRVVVWNRATGRVVRQLPHPARQAASPSGSFSAAIAQVSTSPDGQWLAAVTETGRVAFWAATAEQLKGLARDRSFRQLTPDECVAYLQLSEADCSP